MQHEIMLKILKKGIDKTRICVILISEHESVLNNTTTRQAGRMKGDTIMTIYYVAWSPRSGEASYTRCYASRDERDNMAASIASISKTVNTWDNVIKAA